MKIPAPFLLRTLVLTVIYVVAILLINASDTTDPLGPGLLVFLVFVLVALIWAVVDALRGSAGTTIVVWVLVGAALGVVTAVGILVQGGERDALMDDLVFSIPFFAALIGVPAAIGAGVGALVRRVRS